MQYRTHIMRITKLHRHRPTFFLLPTHGFLSPVLSGARPNRIILHPIPTYFIYKHTHFCYSNKLHRRLAEHQDIKQSAPYQFSWQTMLHERVYVQIRIEPAKYSLKPTETLFVIKLCKNIYNTSAHVCVSVRRTHAGFD